MATKKKAMTFRVSNEVMKKFEILECRIKDEEGNVSKNYIAEKIIQIAYEHVVDGTSSIAKKESAELFDASLKKGIEEIKGAVKTQQKNKCVIDVELLLLEMFEDIELILKMLPYSAEYKNADKSDKTQEILSLVESKSMFRKYTHMKADTILKRKRKNQ